jgi:hypothetical protein
MKPIITLLLVALCCGLVFTQTSADKKQQEKANKERAKQQERERKEAAKDSRYETASSIYPYSDVVLPVSADIAGQIVSGLALARGYTFAGYQPASDVFGAQTAQMALYTAQANWKEALQLGLSSSARTYGGSVKYLAFAVSNNSEGKAVIQARIGLITATYDGYFYLDKTTFVDYRSELNAIILSAKSVTEKRQSNAVFDEAATQSAYQKIRIGITYAETELLLGKGRLLSESETATLITAEYEWASKDGKITATFENGKLVKKGRSGLPSLQLSPNTNVYMLPRATVFHYRTDCKNGVPRMSPVSLAEALESGAHACLLCAPKQ